MKKRVAPTTETTHSNDKSDSNFNSLPVQRQRLLDYLRAHGSITTIEARRSLDILHPQGRIKELRNQGYLIHMVWVHEPTDCGRLHRIGKYFLQPGGES
jgi:hypothetical protein